MGILNLDPAEAEQALFIHLASLPKRERSVVAIAGPPGAGKSALASRLTIRLNQDDENRAALLPLDGFLLDNLLLGSMGRLDRKGAPDTYDTNGLKHVLRRLKANTETEIAVPVYDWNLDLARAGARLIRQSTDIIVVEGSYLLAEDRKWMPLFGSYDVTVMLQSTEAGLRQRLTSQWMQFGLEPEEVTRRIDNIDLPNARFVEAQSADADHVIDIG